VTVCALIPRWKSVRIHNAGGRHTHMDTTVRTVSDINASLLSEYAARIPPVERTTLPSHHFNSVDVTLWHNHRRKQVECNSDLRGYVAPVSLLCEGVGSNPRSYRCSVRLGAPARRGRWKIAAIHCSQPGTSGAKKLNHQTNEPLLPVPRRQLHSAPPLVPAAESPFESRGLFTQVV
jgi:hypothetical protein